MLHRELKDEQSIRNGVKRRAAPLPSHRKNAHQITSNSPQQITQEAEHSNTHQNGRHHVRAPAQIASASQCENEKYSKTSKT